MRCGAVMFIFSIYLKPVLYFLTLTLVHCMLVGFNQPILGSILKPFGKCVSDFAIFECSLLSADVNKADVNK